MYRRLLQHFSREKDIFISPKLQFNLLQHFRNYSSSYFHCSTAEPLLGITLSQAFDRSVEKYGENVAVVDCHQKIRKNYLEYKADVDNFAAGLQALNLKKGDRIGIWAPNFYHWIVTQYAAWRLGLILVGLNTLNQVREQEYCFAKAGLRAVVSAESCRDTQYYAILQELLPELDNGSDMVQSKRFPNLERVIMISDKPFRGTLSFKSVSSSGGFRDHSELESAKDQIDIHDPSSIFFTSGTTGQPKGAVLSHHNIVNMGHFYSRVIECDETEKIVFGVFNPFFHVMGGILCSVGSMLFGHCLVLPSPMYSPLKAVEAIHNEKCNFIMGTPTMYFDLLHHPDSDKYDLSSLQKGLVGGASVPSVLHRTWQAKVKTNKLLAGYGCTECTTTTNVISPRDEQVFKDTTVGKPSPHTEMKIVDDQGRIVPWDTPGEILFRSYSTMLGYWEDEENTRKAFTTDRFYKTGDIGTMDRNGYLKIVGRISDMIIRGGSNIYPKEIEDFLLTNPKIFEVYVFGIPDERLGEIVCAWVLVENNEVMTETEVKNYCQNQIVSYKIPTHVKFVKEFPKLGTGKVDKGAMKQQMIVDMKGY